MLNKRKIIAGVIVSLCIIIPLSVFFVLRGVNNYVPQEIAETSGEVPPVITPHQPEQEQPEQPHTDEPAIEFTIAPSALGQISITPLSESSRGVERDSSFLVTSETQTLTVNHLLSYLSVACGKSFSLEAYADNGFLLRFDETLAPAQIYNILYSPTGMQPASYAFQTTDVFRVTSTSPANSTHSVPHNSGIEITFSQTLENESDFADAFVITPHVEGNFLRRDNTLIFAPYSMDFNTAYTVTIKKGLTSETGESIAEDFTFSFTTRWGTATARPFSISGSAYETFLPWTEIFIALDISPNFPHTSFIVDLYDLQTPENFNNFEAPGEHIETFELELLSFVADVWGSWYFTYLFLGRTLPEGYYLATIRAANDPEGAILEKFIQCLPFLYIHFLLQVERFFGCMTQQPTTLPWVR